jgi:RHS repeat-associated protein
MLLPDSPALDKGSDARAIGAGLIKDQRGSDRYVGTVDIGAFEFSGPIETINPVNWQTVPKSGEAGFGLGWDLANTDRLVLNTDPTNPNAIRWVHSDAFLVDFADLGLTSTADDSGSTISIANDGVTYVRRDKFGNESDYVVYSGDVALLVKSVDRHGAGYAYTYGLHAGAYTIETVSAIRPDQADETTTYHYDADGHVDSITDPFGRSANLSYDASGRLAQIQLPAPDSAQPTIRPTYSFTYDASGFLASVTDADNRITQYAFSASHPGEIVITHPDSGQEHELPAVGVAFNDWESGLGAWQNVLPAFKYKTVPDPQSIGNGYQIDELGRTTVLTFDANGRVIESIDPAHQVTTTERNAAGLPTRVTVTASGNGGIVRDTQYTYDAENNLRRVDYLDGTHETWSYDPTFSQVTEHVDQLGHRSEYTVDPTTGDATEVRAIVGLDDRTSTEHDDVVTQFDYESDGLVKDIVRLRSDVDGTPQLSTSVHYAYTSVADTTAGHVGRWLDSITYGGDDPTISGILLVNAATVAVVARNDFGMATAVNDELGRETQYEYDNLDRLTKVTLPDPGNGQVQPVTEYAYSLSGLLTDEAQTEPDESSAIVTHYGYDPNGRLKQVEKDYGGPNQAETQFSYDLAGNLTERIDALGHSTDYSYDVLNRPIAITQSNVLGLGTLTAPVTLLAYDALGNVVAERDPVGSMWQAQYNEFGQPTNFVDPAGSTHTLQYDGDGHLVTDTDEDGHATTYTYDDAGRLSTMQQPGEASPTVYQYDSAGNLRFVTDPLGHTSQSIYDERGRVTQQIDANTHSTFYGYTNANEVQSLTDSDGNETTWTYDGDGRVASETNQFGYVRTYKYDQYGELTQYIDRDGRMTTYEYDNLHHLSAEKWYSSTQGPLQNTITYQFDAVGNLLSEGDSNSQYSFQYDALGRQSVVTEQRSFLTPTIKFSHGYDAAGDLASSTATIGGVADYRNDYSYDELGRLTTLTQSGQGGNAVGAKRVDLSYNAASQLTNIARYASATTASPVASTLYGYDSFGRLESITNTATAAGATFADNFGYGYDGENRLGSETSSIGNISSQFGYDYAGQLTSVQQTGSGAGESFNYDGNGNRSGSNTNVLGSFSYAVGANNQVSSDGKYSYEYDHEGNLTKRTEIATGNYTIFGWDNRNRLTSVTDYNAQATRLAKEIYTYDAENHLIRQSRSWPSAEYHDRFFAYDNGQVALQFDKNTIYQSSTVNDLSHRYLWGQTVDQLFTDEQVHSLTNSASNDMLWAIGDREGSVRDMIDSNGMSRVHRDFDSFGNITNEAHYNGSGAAVSASQAGYVDEAFAYTGRYFDKSTGLQNNDNRWYDSRAGRWLSEDPMGFAAGDANLFRYVNNEPVNWTDPHGLQGGYDGSGAPGVPTWRDGVSVGVKTIGQAAVAPFRWVGLTSLVGLEDQFKKADDALQQEKDRLAHKEDTVGQVLIKGGEAGAEVGVAAAESAVTMVGAAHLSKVPGFSWVNKNRYVRIGSGRDGGGWNRRIVVGGGSGRIHIPITPTEPIPPGGIPR